MGANAQPAGPLHSESGLVSSQGDGLIHLAQPLPYHAVQTSNSLLRLCAALPGPCALGGQPSVLKPSPSTALRLHD